MNITLPPGTEVRDRRTGEVVAVVVSHEGMPATVLALPGLIPGIAAERMSAADARIEISLKCDLGPVLRSLRTLRRWLRPNRWNALRAQAKRKGRPGWRHIKIPRD